MPPQVGKAGDGGRIPLPTTPLPQEQKNEVGATKAQNASKAPIADKPAPAQKQEDPDREVAQINDFDIGVMPLEDDAWGRGKCGMKLLQFMSMQIPAVASPVGVNAEILKEGIHGFTAQSLPEWESRLVTLIQDADLRRRMGTAARERIVRDYSVEAWFPKILELLRRYSGRV